MPIADPSDLSPRLWIEGNGCTFDGSDNLTAAPNLGSDSGTTTINGSIVKGMTIGTLDTFRIDTNAKTLGVALGAFNTGAISVFFFGKLVATGGTRAAFGWGWPGNTGAKVFYLHIDDGTSFAFGNGCCSVTLNTPAFSTADMLEDTDPHGVYWQLGTANTLLIDDVAQTIGSGSTGTIPNFGATTWTVGHGGYSPEFANADFAALLVFDRFLTTQERTDLYDYYEALAAGTEVAVVPGAIEIAGAVATVTTSDSIEIDVVPGSIDVVGAELSVFVDVPQEIDVVPGAAVIAGAIATVAVAPDVNIEIDVVPGSIALGGATPSVFGVVPTSSVIDPIPGVEYFDTFAPFGSLGGPGDPWVIGVGVDPLTLDAHLGKDMLLIAQPWEDAVEGSADLDIFPPFGSLPDGWSDSEAMRGTLYVAATRGRSTANDDEPPAQYVPGRLRPFNFGNRLFDGVDPLARGGANVGVIQLTDPEGVLDGLINRPWDSTPLILKRGARGTPFKDWPIVGRFRSAGLIRDLDEKQIQLRDLGWQLEGPLHGETYAGTGGREGDDRLTGATKPWALGYCFNVEPILLNAADQIFQWSLSSSQELTELRHGGVAITIDDDYADYAALAAAVIPAGECATCLAESLVRPNIDLEFGIRVDVIGDADTVNGHAAPLTRASIARRIVTHRGPSLLDEASELDLTSFQRMEAYHSAPVGWWFGGDISKKAALDLVLGGVLGWSTFTPDGRLRIGWVSAPESMTATVRITGRRDDVGKPRLVATSQPRRGSRVSWQWNHAPQPDRSSLAGAVSEADAAVYAGEAQYAQDLAPALSTLYPTAKLVTILQAGFRDEADAILEAARQQGIFSVVRNRYERDLQIDALADLIGIGVGVDDDPLTGPQTQLCVGINATGGSSVSTFEFFA